MLFIVNLPRRIFAIRADKWEHAVELVQKELREDGRKIMQAVLDRGGSVDSLPEELFNLQQSIVEAGYPVNWKDLPETGDSVVVWRHEKDT